jgi:methionyl-tRNA formyltransferase
MPQRLLLLTGSFEAGILVPHLARLTPDCLIEHLDSRAALETALDGSAGRTRLLAFCTSVIVPRRLLDALPGPSYNIHPGPPTYPGRHPECWGAYDRLTRFGATLHEMAPRVDEGRIIDVHWFDLSPGAGQIEFGFGAFRAALQLLLRWAPALIGADGDLPVSAYRWSGRKTTHDDLEAMCRIGPDIDTEEFERRRRAFAEQPGSRMVLMFQGREFCYTAPSAQTASGQPVFPQAAPIAAAPVTS